ncbi:hypothetical protein DKG74_00445 [Zavarzinia aquatilis]|uniref:Uncharacterized protein n=2 Tax=Zavarzinia aquatilis TaxID=2211142 RepID=A0A317EFV3_9PROT|nr:hypothetical protein DKG74_00445 [Zavarzinia aquatilis]
MPAPRVGALVPPLPSVAEEHRAALVFLFALTLPMFGQSFHYLIDVMPAYYLSKAWPALTLALVPVGIARAKPPLTLLFLLMLAYVLGVTPMVSMIQLGNGLFDGLATTAKSWPLTYYFSLLGLLMVAKPKASQVERALVILGATTFGLMVLLWIVMPASAYQGNNADSKLFMFEFERGYRIYMPMFFGNLFVFWCARQAVAGRGRLWLLGLAVACILAEILIYKQRTAIAVSLLLVGWAVTTALPRQLRSLVILGGVMAAAVLIFAVATGMIGESAKSNLGGSLTIRQNSLALAFNFMFGDPLRLLFGVGSITRFSAVTMADVFGDAQFFLADLGWVGIMFEYGLLGVLLIASCLLGCLYFAWRNAADGDPMALALRDLILYVSIASIIYSVMFTPGEFATAAALSVYLARRRAQSTVAEPS